jgi:hypothetical protein
MLEMALHAITAKRRRREGGKEGEGQKEKKTKGREKKPGKRNQLKQKEGNRLPTNK